MATTEKTKPETAKDAKQDVARQRTIMATTEKTKPETAKDAKQDVARDYDEITYVPADGDPGRTTWNGIVFTAHVPVRVSQKQAVLVPIKQTQELPDGNIVTKAVERRIPMAELARGNKRFMVNGEAPAEEKIGRMRTPTDPDQYRGYAIAWIAASTAASHMDSRWEAEQALRDRCGVDDGDVAYLRPFFEARHEQCKAAEAQGGVPRAA